MEEQRAARAWPGLRELLRRHATEGEARVHRLGRQRVGGPDPALEHFDETDLLRVRDALLDGVEQSAVEQVGCVHRVSRRPQLVGERQDALGQPLRVVEQQYLSHVYAPCSWRSAPSMNQHYRLI